LLIGLARRIKEALGVPVVCTLMGEDAYLDALPEDDSKRAWDMLTERAKGLDAFVAVSEYYGDVMKNRMSLRDDQLRVVYNGISLDGYAGSVERPVDPTLGYFARMCHGKGLHIVVDAFIELKKRDTIPNLKLRVAGTKTEIDDPFIDDQKKKLAKANLTDAAEFIPNVPREEKIRFLESLSVLSVPVIYGESFGMYLIEAMAAGVPVVQPNSGAFPEIVEQTGGGVTYEPAPGSSALADALEQLLSDPDRAKQLGEQGRQSVRDKFTVDHMARGVVEVYESVLAEYGVR
jgi:glycosyltransferase involved in cell wall biosynthesis